jgi:hypothetical protein
MSSMTRRRRTTTALIVVAILAAGLFFALSAQNDFCLPWQERVGYGDGAIGPGDDYSACR